MSYTPNESRYRGREGDGPYPGPPLREAAGLLMGIVLLTIVYYHGHTPALSERLQLFGWFATNLLLLFVVPALIITVIWRQSLGNYGLRWGRVRVWRAYLIAYAPLMIPVLLIATRMPGFQQYYPRYPWARTEPLALVLSLLGWGVYIFGWEFFFRGFLLHLLARRYGVFAIVIQTVPFMMMHFAKPELECYASLLAGLGLGLMAYHGKSFLGAWWLHWGVAAAMDILVISWPAG